METGWGGGDVKFIVLGSLSPPLRQLNAIMGVALNNCVPSLHTLLTEPHTYLLTHVLAAMKKFSQVIIGGLE